MKWYWILIIIFLPIFALVFYWMQYKKKQDEIAAQQYYDEHHGFKGFMNSIEHLITGATPAINGIGQAAGGVAKLIAMFA
jgi:hypothetical protein